MTNLKIKAFLYPLINNIFGLVAVLFEGYYTGLGMASVSSSHIKNKRLAELYSLNITSLIVSNCSVRRASLGAHVC